MIKGDQTNNKMINIYHLFEFITRDVVCFYIRKNQGDVVDYRDKLQSKSLYIKIDLLQPLTMFYKQSL